LAFLGGWVVVLGVQTPFDPPLLVGAPLAVPATRTLDVVFSTLDAFSSAGRSAWAPVLSEPMDLPLVDGSVRTSYVLVAIGPTADPSDVPPLFTTARWFGEVDRWRDAASRLGWRGFIGDHLLPVLTLGIFGGIYQVPTARLVQFENALRTDAESILAKYGVSSPVSLSARTKVLAGILEEAGVNASYNQALVTEVAETVGEQGLSAERIAAAQWRLRLISRAGLILAVLQAVATAIDLGAVAKDLLTSSQAESWNATATEAAVRLTPQSGTVSPESPSVEFTATVGGDPNRIYLYRWSTSGAFGLVSDFLTDGLTVDSHSDKALYLANDPPSITEVVQDTVTVEVFLDDGSGAIGPGAKPIGKASATVSGEPRFDGKGRVVLDVTQAVDGSGKAVKWCAGIFLAVPYALNAETYVIHARKMPGPVVPLSYDLTIEASRIENYPNPVRDCPQGNLHHDRELWVSMETKVSTTGPIPQADADALFARYRDATVQIEYRP
jgi:hypothetical protein